MNIKELTKEQAIEIAKLQYPFHDWIKSDFDFHYDDGNRGAWIDESDECVSIRFSVEENIEPKNKTIIVHIFPNLDVAVGVFEWTGHYWKHVESRGTANQFIVQNKFREWGILPKLKE